MLFDPEAAGWWISRKHPADPGGASAHPADHEVFCGSLKAWVVLENGDATEGVHWLGGLGQKAWSSTRHRLADWQKELEALEPIPPAAPPQATIRELLSGDLITPALLSLALLPVWAEELASFAAVHLPVGRQFRSPRNAWLGDLPALVLAAVLRRRGQAAILLSELSQASGSRAASKGGTAWLGPEPQGAAWLSIGKLRHPEWPLVQLEAVGLPVVLLEPEPAPVLPDLFATCSRWRCHPQLNGESLPSPAPPECPPGEAQAPASAWLDSLQAWAPLVQVAAAVGRERLRLDEQIEQRLRRCRPALALVPEENDVVVDRFLAAMRRSGRPCAVLHHTAEVQPMGMPLRWQRHLRSGDARLVPLRAQRQVASAPSQPAAGAVLALDPVRAHLLDALELEAPLPWPEEAAVGWIHYPLLQQALVSLADPLAYWETVGDVQRQLAGEGIPFWLARKPPLEPAGLSDARAQGLTVDLPSLPFPTLLERCPLLIAPGHLGTAHLEAMARGRPVVLVSPPRLDRPCLLLGDPDLPMPRIAPDRFLDWWREQDSASLKRLAMDQMEWLRGQLPCTLSLGGWLQGLGVDVEARPQAFLGSSLMLQRPLLDRAEQVGRLARRLNALLASPPGRLLMTLRRGGGRC